MALERCLFESGGKTVAVRLKRRFNAIAAMFEAGGVAPDSDPELRTAIDTAFAVLRAAAEKLVALMPARGRPPALMVALHVWSMTHGIASLFGRGDAARRTLPMPPEELLEAAVLIYLRGLGLTAPATASRS